MDSLRPFRSLRRVLHSRFAASRAGSINKFLSATVQVRKNISVSRRVFTYMIMLWDPPVLDHDAVLIEAVKHADLQVDAGLNHPHRDADCYTPHLDRYLFGPTCPSSQMVCLKYHEYEYISMAL